MARMRPEAVRTWLGIYNLAFIAVLAATFLIGGSRILPLEPEDVTSAFQIVCPFLLAQVTLTFRYYTADVPQRQDSMLPVWIVVVPPLVASLLILIDLLLLIVAKAVGGDWAPGPAEFKGLLTFCVGLLSASTAYVSTKYFQASEHR